MKLSTKNEEKKNLLQNADVSLDGLERTSYKDEIGKKLTWSRFNPDVRVTEGMMWHPPHPVRKHHGNPKIVSLGQPGGFSLVRLFWALLKS
jgi:hypothetical protein